MALYHEIANKIRIYIDKGAYPPGSRLPGVRRLSQQFGVSVSTIIQAERELEKIGLIEARPRSGYYVQQRPWLKPEMPSASQPELKPTPVTGQKLVLQLAHLANKPDFVQLGAAVPDTSFMPMRALQRSLSKVTRLYGTQAANYVFPPGLPELQQQIARRMFFCGSTVNAEKILITNGCQEAISIALQTVAKAGDIIAIESPTFYGLLQVIESLGMQALEIPTDPQHGISLSALELALSQWPIKACVSIPNFSNPLGSLMPENNKKQLVDLARRFELAVIEDDIYGDLSFRGERPPSLHSFAENNTDTIIYCSSFSKTISHGLRIGWMVLPEKLYQRAEYLKYIINLAAPTLPQLALADFLAQSSYERHLRFIQTQYSQQVSLFTHAISHYFPEGTRVSQPQGGFVIWVELEKKVDSLKLSHLMLSKKVSIAPGQIFSASQKYHHCIRLNCAQPWSSKIEKSLIDLGREA